MDTMKLMLRETRDIGFTAERSSWIDDPYVSNYIFCSDGDSEWDEPLAEFKRYYEIYNGNKLVGDIKVFYDSEQDIMSKRAQILMVVGERNQGIGTRALGMLIDNMREKYNSVYCQILRNNVPSLKILKRNGFQIECIVGNNITLSRPLI